MKTKIAFLTALMSFLTVTSMALAASDITLPIVDYAVIAPSDQPTHGTVLLSVPLPESLESKLILQAELICSVRPRIQVDTLLELTAIPINIDWDPDQIRWDDSWRELGSSLIDSMKTLGGIQANVSNPARMDISDIVRRWLDGTYPNYGIAIMTPMDLDRQFEIFRRDPNQREIAHLHIILGD